MLGDLTDTDFDEILGKFGALQLELLLALRGALKTRRIGLDFLRWSGSPDGKLALDDAMHQLACDYRFSLSGASQLMKPCSDVGMIQIPPIYGSGRFSDDSFSRCHVVDISERFGRLFPNHRIMCRDSVELFPYCLGVASPNVEIVKALGTRPYADCLMIAHLLDDAQDNAASPLLTTRSNLFCVEDGLGGGHECIVELWNHEGWHLDAFTARDERIFEPGCRVFSPGGVRKDVRLRK